MAYSGSCLALILGVAAIACGGESPSDWKAGRPRIDKLQYLQQAPRDPYALQFAIDFTDSDANLSGGQLHLFIADKENQSIALQDLFSKQVPPIDDQATEGEMELVVKLNSMFNVGDQIKIGFILEDAKGEKSNDPFVVLEALQAGGS